MRPYYSDTDPAVEELQIRLLRQTPTWRKMQMLAAMNASAKNLALAGLRRRHPQASAKELRRMLAGLLLGEDLAAKLYEGERDGD